MIWKQEGYGYLYDGALDIESSFSAASLFPVSSEFRLGAANGINDSNGEIDDFRIYNRALSKDEIARIYGGGHGDFYNHSIEFSYPEEYQLPIPLTVKFLRDGYPVNVDGTFTNADITITSGDDSDRFSNQSIRRNLSDFSLS